MPGTRTKSRFQPQVGARIRAARETADMSREELATALHISLFMIASYERGSRAMPIDMLPRLCEVLHRPVTYFTPSMVRSPQRLTPL